MRALCEQVGLSKLTWEDVRYIRRHYSKGKKNGLAKKFDVSYGQVWKIANGLVWKGGEKTI
jgi:hypothetical protein